MAAWRASLRLLLANVRTLLVAVGFGALYVGVSEFSRPAANIVAGLILMSLGVMPYVVRSKKGG